MKFLHTTSLQPVSWLDRPPSEYAIFSYHYWNAQSTRPSIITNSNRTPALAGTENGDLDSDKAQFDKNVAQACDQARIRNIDYIWIYALCVNAVSSADINEAVVGSFRLIWDAALCIVHLSDLTPLPEGGEAKSLEGLDTEISRCRWFTRGWTLQELVAARSVEFFDSGWNHRFSKNPLSARPLLEEVSRISNVDASVLAQRETLFLTSLGRRIWWAARRETSRPEDVAYCLVGICGIQGQLTPRYGEGGHSAFLRLQEKILKSTNDLSILAWAKKPMHDQASDAKHKDMSQQKLLMSGVFAESPEDFHNFGCISKESAPFTSNSELTFNSRGLSVQGWLQISNGQSGQKRVEALVLNGSWLGQISSLLTGIRIQESEPGVYVRSNPYEVVSFPLRTSTIKMGRICLRRHNPILTSHAMGKRSPDPSEPSSDAEVYENATGRRSLVPRPSVPPNYLPSDVSTIHKPLASQSDQKLLVKRDLHDLLQSRSYFSDYADDESHIALGTRADKSGCVLIDQELQVLLPGLVSLALDTWKQEKMTGTVPREEGFSFEPTPVSLPHGGFLSSLGTFSRGKRIRRESDDEACTQSSCESCAGETDVDDEDMILVQNAHSTHADSFACPFYKFDPIRYQSCMWQFDLDDINAVGQHVIANHQRPLNCPVCYTVFDTATNRDRHIISRNCSLQEMPEDLLIGVTETQVKSLTRMSMDISVPKVTSKYRYNARGQRKKTMTWKRLEKDLQSGEQQQWFQIWDLVFPESSRPNSPFLQATAERQVKELRAFWRKCGFGILWKELGKLRGHQQEVVPDKTTMAALSDRVFQAMIQQSGLGCSTQGSSCD
ncbi:Vegetative incompatibility protein [Paramyrothecium foliicola]|nr:Vegetative incompatibility protein [Paramyrothecium foliicola]